MKLMPGADLIERARDAIMRNAWVDAREAYSEARSRGESLSPADIDAMAESSWWTGSMRDAIAFREQAHSSFLAEGDLALAANAALRLVDHHLDMGERSIAAAWLSKAESLLRNLDEVAQHAHLRIMQSLVAVQSGDLDASLNFTKEAIEIATRHGDKDLLAIGLAANGVCSVIKGDVDVGMQRLEEATVAAVSGELGALATGSVYCMMISASSDVSDWQRAGQWSEAAKRWCERQAISGYPGICRVHRAEVMRLRGSFSEAEDEAIAAAAELGGFNVNLAGLAFRELGDIRLRIGDLGAAEEAFRQAHEMGASPLPGLALVQIERGKPEAALKSLRRALSEEIPPTERAKLLPAYVHASLLMDDIAAAQQGAEEMTEIAGNYGSPAMHGHAYTATAEVALATGDLAKAASLIKTARKQYQGVDLQFNVAEATALLGRIYQADGDADAAEFEYAAALSRLERLGALPAATKVRARLEMLQPVKETNQRVSKTFLFTDIVKSTDLAGVIGDDAWMDLLGWHDTMLRKMFTTHGGEEISHTGDGFFVAFETPDSAIEAAIAIQRLLADNRQRNGFAPFVRIGLHATEAAEVKGNFHGRGVHEAARIASLAGAGEIITSRSTLDLANVPPSVLDARTVTLKGVAEPMQVVQLAWEKPLADQV